MESGFDQDPSFEIISMPDVEEQENEWQETGAPEAEAQDRQDASEDRAER